MDGQVVPEITRRNLSKHIPALKGSAGTDVTGGMYTKVRGMLDLVEQINSTSVRVFSGLKDGLVLKGLLQEGNNYGTVIRTVGAGT